MPRIFSLRGKINFADNAISKNNMILDYVSPDRTRAWKIKEAYMWCIDDRAEIGSSDGQYNVRSSLATDDIGSSVHFGDLMDPTDNRLCAWAHQGASIRHDAGDDFLALQSINTITPYLVDPDVIVTKELYVNFESTSSSTTSPTRDWAYMVILEETTLSPSESVFQQIKGMGQHVSG